MRELDLPPARAVLRTPAVLCLALWCAIWATWMAIRFSSFDIRVIPGIGPVMLASLVVAVLAPFVASIFAVIALLRQGRTRFNWLVFGAALAVFVGQCAVFLVTRWM
jgi:hypothetical protein